MRRHDLPRVLKEIEEHIFRFSDWCGKAGNAMKVLGPIAVVAFAGLGTYLARGLWLSIPLPLLVLTLIAIPYLFVLVTRSRYPELEVGDLVVDDSGDSHCIHIRVKNLGPGTVKPTVTITHLADHQGKPFPGALESLQAREVHWRGAREQNWNPELKKGAAAFAGVFEVEAYKSDAPTLCTYLNETNEPRRLWPHPVQINDQRAVQLTLLISYKSSKDVKAIERHYLLSPHRDAPLKYRIERVKKFVNSQAVLAKTKRVR